MIKPARSLALVLALLASSLLFAAAARAQSVGRLFFLTVDGSQTGFNLLGGVDELGKFHVLSSGIQSGLAHQTIGAVTDNGIFCYSFGNGGASIVQLDGRALPRFTTGISLSPGWVSATGIGSHVFLYDGAHTGAILAVNSNGTTTQTQTVTNLSPWTNIIPTDNYLVFYNSKSGVLASTVISNIETIKQTSNAPAIINASVFASIGDDLMIYDPGTGNYEILEVLYNGGLTDQLTVAAAGVIQPGFSSVARVNRFLLFYNGATGVAKIGTINQAATNGAAFVRTQKLTLPPNLTIISAGQFLVLYGQVANTLAVGFISSAGQWVQTDFISNFGFFNNVAATAR